MQTETIEIPNTAAAHAPRLSRGSVLVVDDEEQNRTLLHDSLEAHGYEITEAANGLEALERVAERLPDVILLDVMMPQMDGFEVCRRLKQHPITAHVPILMVTALSERKERLMGIAAGANDFLNKPVDMQDVTLRVRNAIHGKHLHDQLQAEQRKSESLLLSIFPHAIAERMKQGETTIAESHPDVTVMLADLVGFTTLSAHIRPVEVVQFLNEIFSAFDALADRYCLEKIKTIGDAYMVAGGLPTARADHAQAIASLALDMQKAVEHFNEDYSTSIRLRVGICTGPVVAGTIGRRKFAYDLWGETVNMACRLEATGRPGAIQVSESTHEVLKDKFQFESKHLVETRSPDETFAYWLGPWRKTGG